VDGRRVAADANTTGEGTGHALLPLVVRRINNALLRADQIQDGNGEKHKKKII
jgi:isocitrate lyase